MRQPDPGRESVAPSTDEQLLDILRDGFAGREAAPPPGPTAGLAECAHRHRLAPLVHYFLRAPGGTPPPPLFAALRDDFVRNTARNSALLHHAGEAAAALSAADVPTLALKGLHLVLDVYPAPGLRTLGDIDLLVPRADLPRAVQILRQLGYRTADPRPIDEVCRTSHHLPPLSRPGSPSIELHHAIERPVSPFRVDIDALWKRARGSRLDGTPLALLAPDDLALHLTLHASYHHRFALAPLRALCDIAALLAWRSDDVDWDRLVQTATDWHASGFVYAALSLTRDMLGAPVPAPVLHDLPHTSRDAELVPAIRSFILTPAFKLPVAYVRFAQRRGAFDRAAALLRGIVPPAPEMARIHELRPGDPRILLHYVLRPLDLLRRRGTIAAAILLRSRRMRPSLQRLEHRRHIDGWIETADAERPSPDSPIAFRRVPGHRSRFDVRRRTHPEHSRILLNSVGPAARPPAEPPDPVVSEPICYFCSSLDTMEPFHRSADVFLLSRLFPSLRWRYCRSCTRHFLAVVRPRRPRG